MRGKHILVVDDDQAILKLVGDFLREYDYKVSTAADAASMHEVLKQSTCDLIVLDLKLPDEDGLSIAFAPERLDSYTDYHADGFGVGCRSYRRA